MNTTANLWELLCRDLETQRTGAEAREHHLIAEKFLQTAREVFASNRPRLCAAIEIAGDVCQASGELSDAAKHFKDSLSKALESESPAAAARISAKLALLLDQMGDAPGAREHYLQALELYDRGHDHSQHAMLLNQLAALCWASNSREEAVKFYQRAIEVATMLHGENHPEVGVATNNLGVAYTQMGNYAIAEVLHMQAMGIREKCFGAVHPEVAQSMANLAVVYHSQGNYDKAEAFYQAALKTYERFPQKTDSELGTVRTNYEALQRRKQKLGSK